MATQEKHSGPTCKTCGFYENNCPFIRGKFIVYPSRGCKDYIYSVLKEQEKSEVDLEKEIDKYCEPIKPWQIQEAPYTSMENCARHFYELGLNARKK